MFLVHWQLRMHSRTRESLEKVREYCQFERRREASHRQKRQCFDTAAYAALQNGSDRNDRISNFDRTAIAMRLRFAG